MHKIFRKITLLAQITVLKILQRLKLDGENWIHYIGGSEALPPPLENDEELYLISKLKDEENVVRTILIERNLRLVVYIARKFENTGIGVEDLVSIGTIGLIKAVNTFVHEKKIKIVTYA